MDIIIGDLAGQYALQTEDATAIALDAAATAGTDLPRNPDRRRRRRGVLGCRRSRLHRHRRATAR